MSVELAVSLLALIGVFVILVLQLVARKDASRGTGEFTNVLQYQEQAQETQAKVLAEVNQTIGALNHQINSQVSQLNTNVENMQQIFHNPNQRGHFGEQQLKDIVESALPGELFDLQHQLSNQTRVDCLIKLPDPPGPIGVDAKFPARSYQDYVSAESADDKKQAQRLFVTAVKTLIKDVAAKYIVPEETSEFALIFVPSEAIFTDIHGKNELSSILDEAKANQVYIVSPNTLMAALNTIRGIVNTMRLQREAKNVLKGLVTIAADAKRLFDRAEEFTKKEKQAMEQLGKFMISADKVHKGIVKLRQGNLELLEEDESTNEVEQKAIT